MQMADSGTLTNSGQLALAAGTTFFVNRGDAGGGDDVCRQRDAVDERDDDGDDGPDGDGADGAEQRR